MPMRSLRSRQTLLLVIVALGLMPMLHAAAPPFAWAEGEAPASIAPASLKPEISSDGQPALLSGGAWLHISVDAKDVEPQVPADGIVLTYTITTPAQGDYEVWNRIGFEAARSDFDWRVDNGGWATIKADAPTTQVQQLQTWNPVAWLKMGTQTLSAGAHTVQIRLPRHRDGKGILTSIQYASDALCLSDGPFRPNDRYQPGDTGYQSATDQAAAQFVFSVPTPTGTAQEAVALKGDWQIARFDEDTIHNPDGPIQAIPNADALFWKSMPVPGDRDVARPEWLHAHRYLLRTRVSVPTGLAGHAFFLHFPAVNMLATVFVNGQRCGDCKTPFATWDCDITQALKPGQVNEVWVGIKDWFYALPSRGATEGGHFLYEPTDWVTKFGPADFTYPIWNHTENGLLRMPSLVVAGPAYVSDVFAQPSVKNKMLGLDVTVHNPSSREEVMSVSNEVVPLTGGAAEKTFTAKNLTVPASGDAVLRVSEPWANPTLWWPDAPHQYNVVTRLSLDGKTVDERTTKFGFREWGWRGANFTLNGVPWHGRADTSALAQTLDDKWLQAYHRHGQDMVRVWTEAPTVDQDLDWYDAHGVCVRRTGIFDGEAARYFLGDSQGKPRENLWGNYRTQLAAWIKSQRNHPSIFIWSVENEITFINGHVTGQDQLTTDEHHKTAQTVETMDPTRPFMVDGGNALLDESFPVYGGHYMEPPFQSLPEGAYDRAAFARRQVWPVTKEKPILLGEAYYANGDEAADFATVGGESAFVGKAESRPAIGLIGKMLSEGYRWNGVSFHFWEGDTSDAYYNSWQPVAVLCRQWDSTFPSGQKVRRMLGIFNDTRDVAPITLTWSLIFGGKTIARQASVHQVAPGGNEKFDVLLPMPYVASRQSGQWVLTLSRGGTQMFKDVRPISVLNTGKGSGTALAASRFCPTPAQLTVFDPGGKVVAFLRVRGIVFTRIADLTHLPVGRRALIIGPDALTPAQSTSSALAAYASGGHTVIVLEQKNPLKYQGLPGEMSPDSNASEGDVAFAEDLSHPVLRGLQQSDFFAWGADGTVYQSPYVKPLSGGRSLVQCGWRLGDTALAAMPAGKGLLLISQLVVGQKLATNAVAQRLLLNMIAYGVRYKQTFHPVTVVASENLPLMKALDATGLQYSKAAAPFQAISKPGAIAVINATPKNLQTLAANMATLNAFTRSGGWVILNNLTPAGLAAFNKIVGYQHLIRLYGQEKVTWPPVRSPLTAGLPTSNIVMGSGKQIFDYAAGQYPDPDAYSYVVDLDDVAPFGKSTFFAYDKIINNYTMADGFWPLIINFPMNKDGSPYQIAITLPRPETLTKFTYVQDLNYTGTTKISLIFDGKDKIPFTVQPNGDPQTFEITPPRRAQNVTLEIDGWEHDPAKQNNGQDLIGVDNMYLYAKRPVGFAQKVRPLLNIGAMVEYPRGKGGLILCNVKYQDTEAAPENAAKKQIILATLLRNLSAPFAGGAKTLIAGASNLTDFPLDIARQTNQYRNAQGWFGDKQFTFADLPTGKQTFAGITYDVYNFTTSPVPTAIMLGGNGIPGSLPDQVSGIPVGRKADALFFLQAARIDQRRSADEVKNNKQYEMADYLIHYADGQTAKVPIYAEINVDNYQQQTPTPLPGAQIAWTRPYSGTKYFAVAYAQQWNNPRPNVPIGTIDLVSGPDRRGVPALLAVTAATAK